MTNDELFIRLIAHAMRPVPARPAHLRPRAEQLRARLDAKTPDELRQLAEIAEDAHHAQVLATWADEHPQQENRDQSDYARQASIDTGVEVAAIEHNTPVAEDKTRDERDAKQRHEVAVKLANIPSAYASRGEVPRSRLVPRRPRRHGKWPWTVGALLISGFGSLTLWLELHAYAARFVLMIGLISAGFLLIGVLFGIGLYGLAQIERGKWHKNVQRKLNLRRDHLWAACELRRSQKDQPDMGDPLSDQ